MAPIHYLDRAAIGRLFGVSAPAVARWQERYEDFPEPAAAFGERQLPGWLPEQVDQIKEWHARRPGQGAPGTPKPGAGRRKAAQPE